MRSATGRLVTVKDRGGTRSYPAAHDLGAGYSGFAFTPNHPHTVRTTETKQCGLPSSQANDNNA
jgi:hypothetical protein